MYCTSHVYQYNYIVQVQGGDEKYIWTWNENTHFSAAYTDSIFTLQDFKHNFSVLIYTVTYSE